jgi:hypothetical protein
VLVFADADVIAPQGWLSALVRTGRTAGGDVVVAGSVANGTPSSVVGTSEYLVQFSGLAPSLADADHGATCNLLVPRASWEALGPFPEDMGGGEDTLLTRAARREGRFRYEPLAAVVHLNRTRVRDVLAHQRDFGRFTAELAERCPDLPYRRLLRTPALAPVAVLARTVAVARRAARLRRTAAVDLRCAPVSLAALVAWGVGLLEGSGRVHRRRAAA